MRCASRPQASASIGLLASARIARPARVRNSSPTNSSSAMVVAQNPSCTGVMRAAPMTTGSIGGRENMRGKEPAMPCTPATSSMAMASEPIIAIAGPPCSRRWKTRRCSAKVISPVNAEASANAAANGAPALWPASPRKAPHIAYWTWATLGNLTRPYNMLKPSAISARSVVRSKVSMRNCSIARACLVPAWCLPGACLVPAWLLPVLASRLPWRLSRHQPAALVAQVVVGRVDALAFGIEGNGAGDAGEPAGADLLETSLDIGRTAALGLRQRGGQHPHGVIAIAVERGFEAFLVPGPERGFVSLAQLALGRAHFHSDLAFDVFGRGVRHAHAHDVGVPGNLSEAQFLALAVDDRRFLPVGGVQIGIGLAARELLQLAPVGGLAAGIEHLRQHLAAELFELVPEALGHALPKGVVGHDDGDLAPAHAVSIPPRMAVAGVFQPDQAVSGPAQRAHLGAAAADVDMRDAFLDQVLRHRQGNARRVFADDGRDFVHRGQFAGSGQRRARVVRPVPYDERPLLSQHAAAGVDLIDAEHDAAADVLADGGGRAGQRQHGTDRYAGLRQRGPGRAQRALQRDSGARCKPTAFFHQELPRKNACESRPGSGPPALAPAGCSNSRPHRGSRSSMPARRSACQAIALLLEMTGLPSACSTSRVSSHMRRLVQATKTA